MRPIFRVALAASCLFASTAVDAQRHSAPAYHPPPPPPPAPRYTPPPPAANQNMRQGSQTGGSTYHGGQAHSGATSSNLGGYRPGSISNSNSQSSGRLSGGAGTSSQHSAQTGVKGTTKSAGTGTTKQAGATGFGKAPANDKGQAAVKGGTKVAAASAGAGLFGAKPAASATTAQGGSTKTSPGVMAGRTAAGKDRLSTKKDDKVDCFKYPKASICQFNCASLRPRPSYCEEPPPNVKTEKQETTLNLVPRSSAPTNQ